MIRWCSAAVIVFVLISCSTRHSAKAPKEAPASLPNLEMATYRPQFRQQVEKAYHELLAKPGDSDANGKLGMLLEALDQPESAEACYLRARYFDSKSFQWAYYLGLVQVLEGKNSEAAENLKDSIRIDPEYVPARIKLAEVLLSLRRLDESRQICESILKSNPQVAPAYYWLGRIASANGQVSRAEEQYRRACDLWPTYGTAHYALALVYQKSGREAEAQRHMTAYQKYKTGGDPQPEDSFFEKIRALDNSALAHLMKGVDFENAGEIEQAITEHEEAVRQDPKLAQAYANLISLYARDGLEDKAERAYRATVAINSNLPQSHYDYGVFLVSRRRFSEAEAAFRKALASSPNYAEAHSNLGAMLERRGKFEAAAREYRAAIEDKPNFRQAQYQLGHLLLLEKKTVDAIDHLSQTLTPEDKDTPRFMYALGIAYVEAGNFNRAQHYLEEAGQRAASLGQNELATQIQAVLTKVEQTASR